MAFLLYSEDDAVQIRSIGAKVDLTIGRMPTSSVVLNHPSVSRYHCRIVHREEGFVLEDLNSRFGTFAGGERVRRHPLTDREHVRVGEIDVWYAASVSSRDALAIEIANAPRAPAPASEIEPSGTLERPRASTRPMGSQSTTPPAPTPAPEPEPDLLVETEAALDEALSEVARLKGKREWTGAKIESVEQERDTWRAMCQDAQRDREAARRDVLELEAQLKEARARQKQAEEELERMRKEHGEMTLRLQTHLERDEHHDDFITRLKALVSAYDEV